MATGTKFSTIYADPPWLYGNQGTRAATGNHYSGMSVAEIAALPVAELAAPNAHLHLWTTNGFLFDAPRIMDAWGFSYKSCFVWVKPDFGMGNYWRVAHEFLLFGIRGSAPFQDRGLISWGEYGRGPHSTKPAEIRDLIERASPAPRLELFARRVAPGWTVWGDNIERDLFYAAD
jgi:N6-adenosine-specific RNA methylase IME4